MAPTSPPMAAPAAKNGLSLGTEPSSFRRRMAPVRWALSGCGPPNASSGMPAPKGRPPGSASAATPHVAHQDVELAVRRSAAPRRRDFHAAADRQPRGLDSSQANDVAVEDERRAIPHEAVDPVPEQWSFSEGVGVESCMLSVQYRYTKPVRREVGMQAIPSSPRSEAKFTVRSSAVPVTAPFTTLCTLPLFFSSTSMSLGPRRQR